MPDEVAGTPSGEVGSDKKPCGWKMNLSRRFIGIGEEIDVLGGDELVSRMEAFETAYLDAARQAFTYLKTQYDQLTCEPPCHKHWDYEPGWNAFSRLMLQAYDGLYLIEVTDHPIAARDHPLPKSLLGELGAASVTKDIACHQQTHQSNGDASKLKKTMNVLAPK